MICIAAVQPAAPIVIVALSSSGSKRNIAFAVALLSMSEKKTACVHVAVLHGKSKPIENIVISMV